MITPVGAVGKVDETASTYKPHTDDLRAAHAAATLLPQVAALQPIPPVYVGGDSTVGDFIYDGTGHYDPSAHPAGSVTIPGVGVFPGLQDETYTTSPVKYEIKVGGVLVARVHDNGVVVAVEGFDFASMGFPASQERGLSGAEVSDSRIQKLAAYIGGLGMTYDLMDGKGSLLPLTDQGIALSAPQTVAERLITPQSTPFGSTLAQTVRLTQR